MSDVLVKDWRPQGKVYALSPCVCGSRKVSLVGRHIQRVECGSCGLFGETFDDHPADAVAAWNLWVNADAPEGENDGQD